MFLSSLTHPHRPRHLLLAAIVLCLAFAVLAVTPARAGGDCPGGPFDGDAARQSKDCKCSTNPNDIEYCASATDYLGGIIIEKVRLGFIGMLKILASIFWILLRAVYWLVENILTGAWWGWVREGLLDQLEAILPATLRQIVFGQSGLFTIALLLAGLLMTLPFFNTSRLVRLDRVLTWGVVLTALFVSSTFGFDLIGGFEKLRIEMMTLAAGGSISPTGQPILMGDEQIAGLTTVVTRPMQATSDELRSFTWDKLWALPAALTRPPSAGGDSGGLFQPVPQTGKWRFRVVAGSLGTDILELIYPGELVRPATVQRATENAGRGVFQGVMALVGGYVLLLFGVIYVILTVASLVLVVFFVAALPLGFFEFGANILLGCVRQYVAVVALSLFSGVMVRLLGGVMASLPDMTGLDSLLQYLGVLVFAILALQLGIGQAWKVTDGAFGVVTQGISTVATMTGGVTLSGPLSAGLAAGKEKLNTATTAALAAGAGLITGGVAGALMAGGGTLLSGTKAGEGVRELATTASPEDLSANVFSATAAVGRGNPLGAATAVFAAGQKTKLATANREILAQGEYDEASQLESSRANAQWKAMDSGQGYLTTDLAHLENARQAFFGHKDPPSAYRSLENAFGSQNVAEQALAAYRQGGMPAAERVEKIAGTSQAVAARMAGEGRSALAEDGRSLNPAYQREVYGRLEQAGLLDPQSTADARFVGGIVGASVRRTESVWVDPEAPQKLARDTLVPDLAEVAAGDTAAQYKLRDLAVKLHWSEGELATLFEAVRQGLLAAWQPGVDPLKVTRDHLANSPAFRETAPEVQHEAARLAYLTAERAEIQLPAAPAQADTAMQEIATLLGDNAEKALAALHALEQAHLNAPWGGKITPEAILQAMQQDPTLRDEEPQRLQVVAERLIQAERSAPEGSEAAPHLPSAPPEPVPAPSLTPAQPEPDAAAPAVVPETPPATTTQGEGTQLPSPETPAQPLSSPLPAVPAPPLQGSTTVVSRAIPPLQPVQPEPASPSTPAPTPATPPPERKST